MARLRKSIVGGICMNDYMLEKVKGKRKTRYYRIDDGKPAEQISPSAFYRLSRKLEQLQRRGAEA